MDHLSGLMTHYFLNPTGQFSTIERQGGKRV
jgi:hypothetical protein